MPLSHAASHKFNSAASFRVLAILIFIAGMYPCRARAGGGSQATTTVLSVSSAEVTAGTAVTLTANVTAAGAPFARGVVVFCDANAARCQDSAIFGHAQLTAAGTATIKVTLGVGTYSIVAAFQPLSFAQASTSAPQALTVDADASYLSFSSIASSGTPGNYTLTGSVTAFGKNVPSGTVSFLDTDSGDAVVGTAVLDSATLGFTLLPALASPATVGSRPQNTVLGDFNNDGRLDLATTNVVSSTLSVLLGNGDGTFQTQTAYAAGASPIAIASGDFNRDGNLDLVVGNAGDATVSVYMGNGDGTFLPQQVYAVGNGPQSIAVADFNGDGWLDLAVVDRNDHNVIILLGQSDGTFQVELNVCEDPLTFPVGESGQVIATADFNGDGALDLAVTEAQNSVVSVLLGLGDGTFQSLVTYAVGFNPIGLAIADFNQDGIPDLAVADAETNTVSVLLGVGDGTFQTHVTYGTGSAPEGLSVGDFNGDGNMDLVASNNSGNSVSVLLGNGDGTFKTQLAFPTGARPFGMGVGDLNGDGLPDVVVANSNVSTTSILLSAQTETATATGRAVFGSGSHEVIASYPGDTDRDASESAPVLLTTIPQVTTATTLTAAPNPAFAGQSVTLTATVVPAPTQTPAGTVSFFNGATLLGTGTVDSSGIATFTTSSLPTGTLSLTAVYSGNIGSLGSTSAAQSVTVNPQTVTATALAASPNPSIAGQPVTLTATITPTPAGTPAGMVSFFSGSTLLGTANVNSSGVAILITSSLAPGTNMVTAEYSGNTAFATSTSSAVVVSAVEATSTALTATPNPAVFGESVTFTATVTPAPTGTPAGTVSFYSGSTLLGTADVNSSGVATFISTTLAAGDLSITAVYSGNAAAAASTSGETGLEVATTFGVTAPSTPFTVKAGAAVDINITVPPLGGSFDSVVIMSASGLPTGATAIFTPPTVVPGASGATTVLTIQTAAHTAGMPAHQQRFPFVPLSLAAGLCVVAGRRKRLARFLPILLLVATLAGATFMLVGCNGGFPAPGQNVTITVTGTSGSQHVSTTVTLIVK